VILGEGNTSFCTLASAALFHAVMKITDESGGLAVEALRATCVTGESTTPMWCSIAWRTSRGLVRERNEDTLLACRILDAEGLMLGVFDGMGGLEDGQRASATAAETFARAGEADGGLRRLRGATHKLLLKAMEDANDEVFSITKKEGRMGTTVTVAMIFDDELLVGHAGDSRAYRLRDNKLDQLTTDHTMIAALVKSGMSQEKAEASGWHNTVLEAVGVRKEIDAEILTSDIRDGDVLLLASDGLHGVVPDYSIEQILKEKKEPDDAAYHLMKRAYQLTSRDNISIIVARVTKRKEEP